MIKKEVFRIFAEKNLMLDWVLEVCGISGRWDQGARRLFATRNTRRRQHVFTRKKDVGFMSALCEEPNEGLNANGRIGGRRMGSKNGAVRVSGGIATVSDNPAKKPWLRGGC